MESGTLKEWYKKFLEERKVRREEDLVIPKRELPEVTLEELGRRMKQLEEGEVLRIEFPGEP